MQVRIFVQLVNINETTIRKCTHGGTCVRFHYANETNHTQVRPTIRNGMDPVGWFNTCVYVPPAASCGLQGIHVLLCEEFYQNQINHSDMIGSNV